MLRTTVALLLSVSSAVAIGQATPRSSPEARGNLAAFATCVVASSPGKARSVLTRDFTTAGYRNELKLLAENNRTCIGGRRGFRASGLPFAAALAEAMMVRDPAPLNARLAKASAGKRAATYGPADAVAMCTARSAPDDVAKLLSTPVASGAEFEAAAAVLPVFKMCADQDKAVVDVQALGLRSIIATASYRLLAAQEN